MHDASFTYDLAGRMLTANTDQQTRTWTYDTAGRPSTHVRSQGGTFSYSYDVASNLTGLTYPDGKAAWIMLSPNEEESCWIGPANPLTCLSLLRLRRRMCR